MPNQKTNKTNQKFFAIISVVHGFIIINMTASLCGYCFFLGKKNAPFDLLYKKRFIHLYFFTFAAPVHVFRQPFEEQECVQGRVSKVVRYICPAPKSKKLQSNIDSSKFRTGEVQYPP